MVPPMSCGFPEANSAIFCFCSFVLAFGITTFLIILKPVLSAVATGVSLLTRGALSSSDSPVEKAKEPLDETLAMASFETAELNSLIACAAPSSPTYVLVPLSDIVTEPTLSGEQQRDLYGH